jgi:hypothetical protein
MVKAVDIDLLDLRELIATQGWGPPGVAEHFKVHVNTIYRLCKRHGIEGPNFTQRKPNKAAMYAVTPGPKPKDKPAHEPLPVSLAMRRLAQFDPVIRRAMHQRLYGKPEDA